MFTNIYQLFKQQNEPNNDEEQPQEIDNNCGNDDEQANRDPTMVTQESNNVSLMVTLLLSFLLCFLKIEKLSNKLSCCYFFQILINYLNNLNNRINQLLMKTNQKKSIATAAVMMKRKVDAAMIPV